MLITIITEKNNTLKIFLKIMFSHFQIKSETGCSDL